QGLLQTIEQFHLVKPQLCSILNRNNDTLYCALNKPDKEQGIYQTTYSALVSIYGGTHLQRYENDIYIGCPESHWS
ncbi:unnamed protein product, partial [Rotaria sp. Silwood1]